ncbi:hypothetical protein [Streptomyces palmae]|uniref:Uncharacterized protein n=1 Tax=Streptomyces palmae TaxID=1701085 RepID=A0A4Z0GI00_9ACTN|nr:hypothetical protein [Streptomyces palmae]TGA95180.1 hypothetical protein E4099_26030 [Streptomyces palmae]
MGTVSGVPENLFAYAAQCNSAAEGLRTWVQRALAPALVDYQSGGGHQCSALDAITTSQITSIVAVDQQARLVGQAFQQAGAVTARPGAKQQFLAKELDLDSALRALKEAALRQPQVDAGAALAGTLPGHPDNADWARISKELAKHADDPYYSAGFFNKLNSEQIAHLLGRDVTIKALVNAYGSGSLSKTASDHVVEALRWLQGGDNSPEHFHITAAGQTGLLKALAADPRAAANFTRLLSAQQIRDLFHDLDAALNPSVRPNLLTVLTIGLSRISDPQQARTVLDNVSRALFSEDAPELDTAHLRPLIDAFVRLYQAGVSQSIPPPGTSGFREWAKRFGEQVGEQLGPFLNALSKAAGDPDHSLLKSMLQGGYVNAAFMAFAMLEPEVFVGRVAFNAAVGAVQSWASSWDPIGDYMKKEIEDGKHPDIAKLNDNISQHLQTLMISMMVSRNLVYKTNDKDRGHFTDKKDRVSFTGDTRQDSQLLHDILASPNAYHVGGYDANEKYPPSVRDMFDAFGEPEAKKAVKALGQDYKFE